MSLVYSGQPTDCFDIFSIGSFQHFQRALYIFPIRQAGKLKRLTTIATKEMYWSSTHIKWLDLVETFNTEDGLAVQLYAFKPDKLDDATMKDWARHFRNHYCGDDEIDFLRMGTKLSRAEYLRELKFPTSTRGFGPGVRAGDFAEILLADFLEYKLGHYVPRTRYITKTIRDESTKGSDLIGIKLFDDKGTPNDILTIFEVKAQFSGDEATERLQDAIEDSIKDHVRKAESLNAIRQRLFDKKDLINANLIARFQNPDDYPYTEQNGAAAFFNTPLIDRAKLIKTKAAHHPNKDRLLLVVFSAEDCMNLVHELYERAANEA